MTDVTTHDMSGQTVVITGGNSGIGFETAAALAGAGAAVIITVRDGTKGEKAVKDVAARHPGAIVDSVVFDLSCLASVRYGAQQILDRCPRIDVLINNAGLVLSERRETVDGLETTFAVNYLGHFLLSQLLLDRIKASAPARIINLSSPAHKWARQGLDFDDLQSLSNYRGTSAYSRSKLANIYFTTELARRVSGSSVTVNCLHPGSVSTGIGSDGDATGLFAVGLRLIKPFVLTAEKGARTSIYLASSPVVANVTGEYFFRCKSIKPSHAARDDLAAARLWAETERLLAATR
jgi:NAD(P)-dependent dehydrogenase (short-subunit alcohol dehydrogenase family)